MPKLHIAPPKAPQKGSESTVVISWLSTADAEMLRTGEGLTARGLDDFIRFARVVRPAPREGTWLDVEPPGASAGGAAVVVRCPARLFWTSALGGGGYEVAVIASAAARDKAEAVFERVPPRRRRPVVADRFRTPRRGDPEGCWVSARRFGRSSAKPATALFLLPGLGSDDRDRLADRSFTSGLSRLAARGSPLILVIIDMSTVNGTHYLSERSGADGWLELLADRIPAEIQKRYGLASDSENRILLGHSAGGFNAIQLAMRAPGRFGSVIASCPDALDLVGWLTGPDGRIRPRWLDWMRFEADLGEGGQMASYAASWSPSGSPIDWPGDLRDGSVSPDVLAGWRRASPIEMLAQPGFRAALDGLGGRLAMRLAAEDEFDLAEPARAFGRRLAGFGIAHQLQEDPGGHFGESGRLLQMLAAALGQETRDGRP